MNDMEKRMMDRIRESAEDTEIPERLRPEWVEENLSEANVSKRSRKPRRGRIYALATAAVIAIALTCTWAANAFSTGRQTDEAGGKDQSAELSGESDYSRIYELVKTDYDGRYNTSGMAKYDATAEIAEESASAYDGFVEDLASSKQAAYSGTNIQTEGVDEGDIVKNDGRCIYYLDMGMSVIYIIDGKDGNLAEASRIELPDGEIPEELYLSGGRLVLVSGCEEETKLSFSKKLADEYAYKSKTRVTVYDVSDPEKPKKDGSFTMDGWPDSSRLADGYLYVFTSYWPDRKPTYRYKETYVPAVGAETVACGDIYVPENAQSAGCYTTVASVDIKNPAEAIASKSVLAADATYYMSDSAIYVACADYSGTVSKTELFRFSYEDGELTAEGKTRVRGTVDDSFSMGEYGGHLRMVVTETRQAESNAAAEIDTAKSVEDVAVSTAEAESGQTYNSLYVLDENLEIVGSIRNLAKGERVKSARFMGETGYFVTFRDIDPLFSVDLRDPENPEILGELKVTGFSEYLHFYDDDLLLGIGEEVAADENAASGVKISMFDISDPANVTEKHKKVFKKYNWADALYDHHAVFIEPGLNLFGFSLSGDTGETWVMYRYDEAKGFERVMTVKNIGYEARGLYMGDVFCLVMEGEARAYSMEDYRELSRMDLN